MSQVDREDVYSALFSFLQGMQAPAGPFQTIGRRLKQIESCQEANAPYLFQIQKGESSETPKKGVPTKKTFKLDLAIYHYGGQDETVVSSTPLNELVTAVEDQLAVNAATNFQQLGIQVSSVRVNGQIQYFENILGAWWAAVVPVEIVATL